MKSNNNRGFARENSGYFCIHRIQEATVAELPATKIKDDDIREENRKLIKS